MRTLKQSTAANVMLLMVDSTDHVTGKTGLTLTVTLSKDGAAFGSISPTVTERGNGWYNIALTSAHTDTLGDLVLRATGTAADPAERTFWVAARVNDDFAFPVVSGRGIDVDATGGVEVGSIVANAITASAIATGAITAAKFASGAIDATAIAANAITSAKIATDAIGAAQIAANAITSAKIAADAIGASQIAAGAITSSEAPALANLDAAVSTRLATAGYTAPDNASVAAILGYVDTEVAAVLAAVDTEVAAIKAKTDQLTFTVANQLDANIQYVNDVAVTGDGQSGTEWGPA